MSPIRRRASVAPKLLERDVNQSPLRRRLLRAERRGPFSVLRETRAEAVWNL
jgi:hypothetical protein